MQSCTDQKRVGLLKTISELVVLIVLTSFDRFPNGIMIIENNYKNHDFSFFHDFSIMY